MWVNGIISGKKKGFTLVELIIVITILAILSVSAFLVVSQWIGKSRDSRRLADLGTIQRALEVSLTENAKYPIPDSAVNITAGSIIIGQQGKFGDSARSATDIKTTPMDPLDNVAYTYYVATGGKNYQVMGFLENSSTLTFRDIESQGPRSTVSDQENLQFSNSACTCNSNGTNSICSVAFFAFCLNYAHASEVSAADYSVRIPTVKGETLGILILSGTNQPVEELGSTVDLNTITSNLIAVFSNTDKSSGTGGEVISPVLIKNTSINPMASLVANDNSIVGYWDMETLTSTGVLKDFSKYGNHGTLGGGIIVGNVSDALNQKKATKFDGVDDYIDVGTFDFFSGDFTIFVSIQKDSKKGGYEELLAKRDGWASDFSDHRRGLFIDSGTNNMYFGRNGTSIKTSSLQLKSRTNYSITHSFNKNLRGYQNGELVSDMAGTLYGNKTNARTVIGRAGNQNGEYYQGIIGEIRIYNRILSDAEIRALSKANGG